MKAAAPFRIGLLYSTSGTTSVVEIGQLKASLLAIDEVNARGGIQFEPVVADIRSDPGTAAARAEELRRREGVDVLVGCWTSACRKAVLPVLDARGGLLLYTTNYEGQESHPGVIYLGAVPNQQVDSMLSWVVGNLAARFILVGSDYIYPQSTNRQVRQWLERLEGDSVVLERYFPLGTTDFSAFFQELGPLLHSSPATVIFSTLVGSSVAPFYQQYRQAGFTLPIVSPITSECEIAVMGASAAAGHYCTSGYFQSLGTEENQRFVALYQQRHGREPINGSMALAYNAIQLLAMACEGLRRDGIPLEAAAIRRQILHRSFDSPEGRLIVDPRTQHLWLWSRIGRVDDQGRLNTVWSSPGPIPPRPWGTSVAATPPQPLLGSEEDSPFARLVGGTSRFRDKINLSLIAARTQANVLITGESGTGKELCAQAIHQSSDRKHGPFLPINCAAIPRDLIASELFGYEDGAFTGARKGGRAGRFEQARGGTLFLDEIGEMPLELQGHLLRVLQEGEIYRLGGKEAIAVDVRIIAATNKDLEQEIAFKGTFRSDLYYRLNVFSVALPPLRERAEDILLLADHFLATFNQRAGVFKVFSPECRDLLQKHLWPGNVRELANCVERAFHVSLDQTAILPGHFPEGLGRQPASPPALQQAPAAPLVAATLQAGEEELIQAALRATGYNLSHAARRLGIARSTLYRKLQQYGLRIDRHCLVGTAAKTSG